ncbi:virion core protein (lumpy skin disease virus) [Actinotalea ferrariae CF5-4]|uniref:Virion core protein (Lumpy skin disease virus) n=1 Tax=Actinotalea ferrariae CF5-4 TaxID=948458 RepID=A0A021VMW0_9CELL|nr:SPFH domain-containing protein [Actinotalea ferrariae]EYR62438.1 virion core protein (lumpy skin disease virus) [Actinotalea ferrariae CF5-4]
MGLFKAAAFDALHGVLADQWKDFYTVPDGLPPTAALFAAVRRSTDSGRGVNTSGSDGVISNGSRIVVPEGYAVVLLQDGGVTGLVTEPGGYEWRSDAPDSRSVFAGDGLVGPLKASWDRFRFGGRPQAQQHAFFVSMKELPNNRFGTASEIYWDDAYLSAQAGAVVRGTYTLRIADPILFIRNWVPAQYLRPGVVFDFADPRNDAAAQLFHEVVGCIAQALSIYTNDPSNGNRITRIQQDVVGVAQSLSDAVERAYRWRSTRGLEVVSTAILGLEYDEPTRELLRTVQRADALLGARGNSNMQASVAAGLHAAGESGGAAGMLGLAIAAGASGAAGLQQPSTAAPSAVVTEATSAASLSDESDPVASLTKFKQLLDAGLITQADYDAAKAKVLGL